MHNHLSVWNPSTQAAVVDENEFEQMGEQLTAQYKVAVPAMWEVVKLGTMLMHVRNRLLELQAFNVSTVDTLKLKGGRYRQGMGLKAWLEEYAPDISRSSAYRFMGIANSVADNYPQIVGSRIAGSISFCSIVLTDTSELPAPVAAKQLQLFEYVNGTSQTSWMDRFKAEDDTPRGGPREGAGRKVKDDVVEAEKAKIAWSVYMDTTRELLSAKKWKGRGFIHLDRKDLLDLDDMLMDLRKEIKVVLTGNLKPVIQEDDDAND